MPRIYKTTGKPRGAPAGNDNALKHGAHSMREKAEHLRAESALRAARALNAAAKLEEQSGATSKEEDAERERGEANLRKNRERFARLKEEGNLRGVFVDIMHERVALMWLELFPDQPQPDWVHAWANIQPNAHQSPPFEDGHDIAPGIPGKEGETPQIFPGSIPPRVHRKTKIGHLVRGWPKYVGATAVSEEMTADFLRIHPEFGTRANAVHMLEWAIRTGLLAPG